MANPENMVLRTVYLPKALDKELREIAFRGSVTKGELMRALIGEALEARAKVPGKRALAAEPAQKITTRSRIVRTAEPVAAEPAARKKPAKQPEEELEAA